MSVSTSTVNPDFSKVRDELRRMMWNYVGIVRTGMRLERAQHRFSLPRDEVAEYYARFSVTRFA